MRVYLTNKDLESEVGRQLLELSIRIATDGKLDIEEIRELRNWLRKNKGEERIPAVPYLHDIMSRIASDGVIDREEIIELFLAVERVIPPAKRTHITQARKAATRERKALTQERLKEARRIEREKAKQEAQRLRDEQYAEAMRLRHTFAKVAGVTFQNDDGTERQHILARCRIGEALTIRHDPENGFSEFATQVLRTNSEQLGFVPEYLAAGVCAEIEDGYEVFGVLKNLTGGTSDRPLRGANFVIFIVARDVPNEERSRYVKSVLDSEGVENGDSVPRGTVAPLPVKRPWWKFW